AGVVEAVAVTASTGASTEALGAISGCTNSRGDNGRPVRPALDVPAPVLEAERLDADGLEQPIPVSLHHLGDLPCRPVVALVEPVEELRVGHHPQPAAHERDDL